MINFHEFRHYVDSLYKTDKAFDDSQTDRLARHRHLEPESAQFLASLIINNHASNVLEIGTSTGYSTLWLAYALSQVREHRKVATHLTSIELDAQRLLTAKNHLMTLSLNDSVSVQQADAKDFLVQVDKPFDMIFLDAERQFYMDYAADLVRLLDFGSALIVDNVISHAAEVADFLAYFEQDNSLLCTTLPIGAGLFMAVKQVA